MRRKRSRRSRRREVRLSLNLAARKWTGPEDYLSQLHDDPNNEVRTHGHDASHVRDD